MRFYVPSFLPFVAALGLAAGPGFASDGVLEINQTCAVNTGCFSGDAAGFPVTISLTGRSFVLTSRLFVPDANTDVIVVNVPSVSIDLNGFEIDGPVTCAGDPLVCTPSSGTGSGVEVVSGSGDFGASVKNGSIIGMGNYGVFLGDQAEVTNLRVRSNRLIGIFVGIGSTVSGNTAHNNGNTGILTSSGSIVSSNTAHNNGGNGIFATSGSTIQRNTVRGNAFSGLLIGGDATYRENTITANTLGPVTGATAVNKGDNYCSGPGTVSAFCP